MKKTIILGAAGLLTVCSLSSLADTTFVLQQFQNHAGPNINLAFQVPSSSKLYKVSGHKVYSKDGIYNTYSIGKVPMKDKYKYMRFESTIYYETQNTKQYLPLGKVQIESKVRYIGSRSTSVKIVSTAPGDSFQADIIRHHDKHYDLAISGVNISHFHNLKPGIPTFSS